MTAGAGLALLAGLATPAEALPWGWQPAMAPAPEISQPRQLRPTRTMRAPRAVRERAAPAEPSAGDAVKTKQSATDKAKQSPADLPSKVKDPLQIVVSVDRQQVTVYSGSHPIVQSRVSTGTPGYPTPTGVFSIIQKDRWHRSNIYDDAPMYYMQRITWSGVAMHQGVVPNHPASHGCIRLPEAFARQLWGITKLGVRVIVSRGEVTPVAFAHPKLFVYKQPDPAEEKQPEQAAVEGSSTDLVSQAYRALETAQAFSKPAETATDASRPGETGFTVGARA